MSAVERWTPGWDAIQMTKRPRRIAATPVVAPNRRRDTPSMSTGASAPGASASKASAPGAPARVGAPDVPVSAGDTAMSPIAPALSVGPSVIDVLRIVGSATRRNPRMSRGATQEYLSWRAPPDEILQVGGR